jgi:hypothetical protein
LQYLKLIFASLKESGKLDVNVNINVESKDKLKTYLKVIGFQSLEIEELSQQNSYKLYARKPEVITQPTPPKIRRKNKNQTVDGASQNPPAANPWANLDNTSSTTQPSSVAINEE